MSTFFWNFGGGFLGAATGSLLGYYLSRRYLEGYFRKREREIMQKEAERALAYVEEEMIKRGGRRLPPG